MIWAGVMEKEGREINKKGIIPNYHGLAAKNDDGDSFEEIADFIDNNREKIFK